MKKDVPPDPLNILFFSSFGHLRWGGQKSLHLLVRHLDRERFNPIVSVPEEGDLAEQLRRERFNPIVVPLPPVKSFRMIDFLSALRRIIKIIKNYNIRLIHTDGPRNTLYGGLAARLMHVPLVWHIRSSEPDPYDRILCRLCDRIILVAEALKPRFSNLISDERIAVVHNGIPLKEVGDAAPFAARLRSEINVDPDTLLLVQAARIDPMKGQMYLLKACAILKDHLKSALLLVGEIYDRDYYDRCQTLAHDLGLEDRIVFLGHRDDIDPIVQTADIVILSSPYGEAFPRSIIEAMAAAKPVVATDVGGNREAVDDGVTGFIVPPRNEETLADRIRRLGQDREMRVRMGQAARKRAEERFSISDNVRKTEEIYLELLHTK